jgi:acetoin utilization deacetylase AcuC-like enzyme
MTTTRIDPCDVVAETYYLRVSIKSLRCAGAACHAIDQVCSGANKNAFCVVRPPGHHAGSRGVVEGGEEKHGSAGFCLLNRSVKRNN